MKQHINLIIGLCTLGLTVFVDIGLLPGTGGLNGPGPVTARAAENNLKAGMIDPATGKKIKYWAAPMDPAYIRNEPGKSPMGMDLVPVYEETGEEKEPTSTIRIDPVTVQNMGVRTGRVQRSQLTRSIRAFGNVTYNEKTLYAVNTKFSGWIEKLHVDFVGDRVEKGQPLFEIYSPELLTAQEEYRLALRQSRTLSAHGITGTGQTGQTLLAAAETRLRYWDLTEEQIQHLKTADTIGKTVTVYSPARGVVIAKKAFQGHYVRPGEHLYEIADLSTVWVDVDIYEYELPWIHRGMSGQMNLSYVPGKTYQGKVLYIYPFLNEKTRTARLRLAFANPDETLKPGMYANVNLTSQTTDKRLVVPQEAVIDSGVRKIVFVALGKGRFAPREVRLGMEGDHYEIEVTEGLQEGEQIVISGQFMFDSESRLREAIGKMLTARLKNNDAATVPDTDMDMTGVTMESETDDLDMTGLTMEPDKTEGLVPHD
jgi:Cu(I)/Ag(I) efflux system membrane fusion protein/cobalt-zinc-cadmium efflux system membrane fusion protein